MCTLTEGGVANLKLLHAAWDAHYDRRRGVYRFGGHLLMFGAPAPTLTYAAHGVGVSANWFELLTGLVLCGGLFIIVWLEARDLARRRNGWRKGLIDWFSKSLGWTLGVLSWTGWWV